MRAPFRPPLASPAASPAGCRVVPPLPRASARRDASSPPFPSICAAGEAHRLPLFLMRAPFRPPLASLAASPAGRRAVLLVLPGGGGGGGGRRGGAHHVVLGGYLALVLPEGGGGGGRRGGVPPSKGAEEDGMKVRSVGAESLVGSGRERAAEAEQCGRGSRPPGHGAGRRCAQLML